MQSFIITGKYSRGFSGDDIVAQTHSGVACQNAEAWSADSHTCALVVHVWVELPFLVHFGIGMAVHVFCEMGYYVICG